MRECGSCKTKEKEVKKTQRPNARIARIRFRTEADTHTGRRSPGNHSDQMPGSSKVTFALLKHYVLRIATNIKALPKF